jgi:hypothetical protein
MLSKINFLCEAWIYTYFVGVTLRCRLPNINFLCQVRMAGTARHPTLPEKIGAALLPAFPFAMSTENKRNRVLLIPSEIQ